MTDVKGIGDGAPEGWVLEEFEVPMPRGLKSILETIRSVLQQGRVQSVNLRLGHPIRFTRLVEESEASQKRQVEDEGSMSLGEVARNVQMEESAPKQGVRASDYLVGAFLSLEMRRLHLSHIGVGVDTRFFDWLGIDKAAYGGIENLAGARLVQDNDIPDDVVIVFASPYRQARVDQITYAIKSHMFLAEEDLMEEQKDGSKASG